MKALRENVRRLREVGVGVVLSVVVGYYGETVESVERTAEYLGSTQADLVKVNVWSPLPGEERSLAAERHGFVWNRGQWSHASMNLQEAYDCATRAFHKSGSIAVPPETSVFDQWPQLAAEGVVPSEIVRLFHEYHQAARGA